MRTFDLNIFIDRPRDGFSVFSCQLLRSSESEEGRTRLVQKVRFEQVNKLLENFVFDWAIQTQRALLANLKVRLVKS
jgi:hypothetical protein